MLLQGGQLKIFTATFILSWTDKVCKCRSQGTVVLKYVNELAIMYIFTSHRFINFWGFMKNTKKYSDWCTVLYFYAHLLEIAVVKYISVNKKCIILIKKVISLAFV